MTGSPAALDADVAVVGVGTMGALALWQLARRGVSAVGFEQYAPGHDRGSAGGESRLFRTAYREGSAYVPLLRSAREQWRALEAETGVDLLTLDSGLMIGSPDGAFLGEVLRSIREHDIAHEVVDAAGMRRRFPQHLLQDGEIGVLDRESGWLRPELAVTVAAAAAEARGAVLHRRTRVTAIRFDDDAVVVVADGRERRFGQVVVAAGAWTNVLLPGLTPELDVQRLIMTWFPTTRPERFASAAFPIFIRQTDGFDISGWPTLDGASVKVAINHGWDHVADVDHVDRGVDDRSLAIIRDAVARFLPDLVPEPVRASVYFDGYTNDHHAVVGRLPADDRVVILGGFSGHGFKMASSVGLAAADLVVDGTTSQAIHHLDPRRFAHVPTVADRLRLAPTT
jgi:sarcosine oxidase